jgi:hypothetical protein
VGWPFSFALPGDRAGQALQLERRAPAFSTEAHGRFRTYGTYAAATVRGTDWDMINRCDGTLTFVLGGTVSVYDYHLRRHVTVHAGQLYLAKAR